MRNNQTDSGDLEPTLGKNSTQYSRKVRKVITQCKISTSDNCLCGKQHYGTELRFYVPLDTKQVIPEMFFRANLLA